MDFAKTQLEKYGWKIGINRYSFDVCTNRNLSWAILYTVRQALL